MRFTVFVLLAGDAELSGVLDANGSNESFELVTEENNGDGGKKQGTEGRSLTKSADFFERNKRNGFKLGLSIDYISKSNYIYSVAIN